jgi:hypothetical protein
MEKPNLAEAKLAAARERIEALTGLLDAIAALADLPLPAEHNDPVALYASQRANDQVTAYASGTAKASTDWIRDKTKTVAEKAAEPLPYATRESETFAFGAVRAAYLASHGLPEAESAQPEAGQ